MYGSTGDVMIIPGKRKEELLKQTSVNLRIQTDDATSWMVPTQQEVEYLEQFVSGNYKGYPAKSWIPAHKIRIGWTGKGVYIHSKHKKRFFGVPRNCVPKELLEEISPTLASVAASPEKPQKATPEAVPRVNYNRKSDFSAFSSDTGNLLGKLEQSLHTISDDVRDQVLRATFRRADTNQNGTLSRAELAAMIRKMVQSMSGKDIELLMDQADPDHSDAVSYEEFVNWLQGKAPDNVSDAFKQAMSSDSDLVRIGFRVWDTNGDGSISKKELQTVLQHMCPNMKMKQIDILLDIMDTNNDQQIDYDEFVDFLFNRR